MSITKSKYYDRDGNVYDAYIKDGVAYTDEGTKNRVNVGSIVRTNGGDFYRGPEMEHGVRVDVAGPNDDYFTYGGKRYKSYTDQNGVSYVDAAGTTRTPTDTTVMRAGSGYYNSKELGEVPTMQGAVNNYQKNTLNTENHLRQAAQAQHNMLNSTLKTRLSQIAARRSAIEEQYNEANRASYNAYLNSINPYGVNAEQLARLGLSDSGYAETTSARIASTYQNAIAGNARDRANAMLEIELAMDDAIAENDAKTYEVYANMYNNLAKYQNDNANNIAQMEMQAAEMVNNNAMQETQWPREDADTNLAKEIQNSENQRETAETILKYINSGMTYSEIARILGVDVSVLQSIVQAYFK